jgi:hypothetical protein
LLLAEPLCHIFRSSRAAITMAMASNHPLRANTAHGNQQRPLPMLCCNRCRKPFTATLYVLACDCALCEGEVIVVECPCFGVKNDSLSLKRPR